MKFEGSLDAHTAAGLQSGSRVESGSATIQMSPLILRPFFISLRTLRLFQDEVLLRFPSEVPSRWPQLVDGAAGVE